ncbi:ABC transporter ATP-binding protein [Oceanibaculum indicum]|uniref:Sulfonate transport system ATP-binding protein n=1 Tax=Oceanibaculum indicum TaxID=526216 RepID=A0A420WQM0_9PROT|nr:ABC transporter ATP-binding protein [Oceanibaculum indicum]RKQ73347.1 sulfonate transport system ATP-binding protein [Oceanibaculum indicum]
MLAIDSLAKHFPNGVIALNDVDLAIDQSEIVSLVGTSGCGKSTLLRILSGLESASHGRVAIDGDPVSGPHPEIGMVFQEARLMPWLSVADNVRFALNGEDKAGQDRKIAAVLAKVGLADFAGAYPRQLSGGMAQRVAIARALVRRPSILLLDEPFSALDSFTRLQLQDHLLELWREERFTMVFVTHDVEEAVALSDRIVVMRGNPGHIHAEFALDLPRPRRRTDSDFQHWKEKIVQALDLS